MGSSATPFITRKAENETVFLYTMCSVGMCKYSFMEESLGSTRLTKTGTFSSLFLNWFLLLTTRNPNPQSLVSFPPDLVDLKKYTAWELQVKFFGGKTQETAPQIEKLPQGGRGESSVYMWFLVSGKYCNQEYIFFQKSTKLLHGATVPHD